MLNEFEQRALRGIERWLENDDPEFAARFRAAGGTTSTTRDLCQAFTAVAVAGMALAVLGLLVGPALLTLYGVCLTLTACWLRLVLSWMERGQDG